MTLYKDVTTIFNNMSNYDKGYVCSGYTDTINNNLPINTEIHLISSSIKNHITTSIFQISTNTESIYIQLTGSRDANQRMVCNKYEQVHKKEVITWEPVKTLYNTILEVFNQEYSGEDYDTRFDGYMNGELCIDDYKKYDIVVVLVDDYGGEDQGSSYGATYKFSRDNEEIFFNFYGYYASFHGADYEGYNQVFPKEVTETKYVTKNEL